MHRKLSHVLVLLVLVGTAAAQDADVNLALFEWGGMPSAVSSAPDLAYSAQKAADGRPDTGWVSGVGAFPAWLRVEWRFPVQVRGVTLRQWPGCPVKEVGGIGAYGVEALVEGQWRRLASGDAAKLDPGAEVRAPVEGPVSTLALRLVVEPAAAAQVAVSEVQILGPKPVLPWTWAPAWQARYIWAEPSLILPNRQPVRRYFRRMFELAQPEAVREAWLTAFAFDRLNGLWLNNRPLLQDGSYNGGLSRQASFRQVPKELLLKGENVLAASVDDLYECGSNGLAAELLLINQDGARTVVATDGKWKAQEDAGPDPDWRKPGFGDTRWVACTVVTAPTAGWHWLWGVPVPVLAPPETFRVVELQIEPAKPRPGTTAKCHLSFECTAAPQADYAISLRLGQHSFVANHDYELWGTVLPPAVAKTSAWGPGRRRVTLELRVPDEAPQSTPATLLVSLPTGGVGLDTSLPGCRTDAYGLHFAIPVDRGLPPTPAASAPGFRLNEIRTVRGTPTLHLDGRPVAPILFSSAYGNYRRYSEYTKTGVRVFRPVIDGSPICASGEEDRYYPWWFAQIDRMLEAAVGVEPRLKLLPAVFMDPSPAVLFSEPSEQMVSGGGQLVIPNLINYPDRGQVRPTFMSQEWRRLGAEGLRRLVEHLKAQSYAPNIIGLWFFAGRGGENYYGLNELNLFFNEAGNYDAKPREQWDTGDFSGAARVTFREFLLSKYKTDAALQAAWQRPDLRFDDILNPARFRRDEIRRLLVGADRAPELGSLRDPLEPGVGALPMDYYQCFAEAMIDTFAGWGKAVKDASDNRLLTGCYYGYTLGQLLTNIPGFCGHTAVVRAFETPYLDLYCSPTLYEENRSAGHSFWGFNIIDSMRLHNKLWIYEQDSRTHLAEAMPKTFSRDETLAVLGRDCAAALTHSVGWWWYEFADGQRGARSREWFADPEIADFAAHIKRVYDFSLTLPARGPCAQIAVLYHGETHTAQDVFPAVPLNVSLGRLTLFDGMQSFGAPADLYNLADLPLLARSGALEQYRMCVFLNPFYLTATERQALELCKGNGRTLVWLWAPGLAQVGKPLAPEHVTGVTGIKGVRWLREPVEPTCRLTAAGHPLLAGLPHGYELAPRPMAPGSMWERFGNRISPLLYVDPAATDSDTQVLGRWVLGGQLREDLGAFCVRAVNPKSRRRWTSVYSAVPYLSPELLRNLARFAGVHVYREANDVLYADRSFVAIHTGAQPATDTLRLPRQTPVYDVFCRQVAATQADSVKLNIPPFSTVLYYLGDIAAFKAAVESEPQ